MSVTPGSPKVGECYLSDGGHLRRVTHVMPDRRVGFEWRQAYSPRSPWRTGMMEGRAFASSVVRPVRCDYVEARGKPGL
jgi:hypothetical protein